MSGTACSLLLSTSDLSKPGAPDDGSSSSSSSSSSSGAGGDGGSAANDSGAGDGGGGGVGDAGDPAFRDPRLVAAWTFDEQSPDGTFVDQSGHGNKASLLGGATFLANAGHRGGGIEFHRSLEEAISATSLDGNQFPTIGTVSLWWRYSPAFLDQSIGLFDFFDDSRSHLFARHPNGEADETRFQVAMQGMNAPQYLWVNEFNVPSGVTWHHLVITWSSPTREFAVFVNNELMKRTLATGTEPVSFANQQVRLGRQLAGMIDEVRLYNSVLTDPEIKSLP